MPAFWPGAHGAVARESDWIELPITIGALRPVVLLPSSGRGWPVGWRRSAVAHEVAHVRQRDPMLQAVAELVTALYWFHPLAWRAARQLRIERELAADDQVLLQGSRGADYAELLVTLACQPDAPATAGAVLPLLTPAGLKARLLGILDGARPRLAGRLAAPTLAACGLFALVPLAAALPMPPSTRDGPLRAPDQLPQGTGFVLGKAVDAVTGAPISGAQVDFVLGDRTLRVITGDDGLVRSPTSYDGPPESAFVLYARRDQLAARMQVLAIPYGTKLPVELRLAPALTARGVIRSRTGAPVAGARLKIIGWDTYAVGPGGGTLTRTGADGTFTLPGLLYGRFTLVVVTEDGVSTAFVLRVGQEDPAPLVLTAATGDDRGPSGWLRNENGQPLAGVRIERLLGMQAAWSPGGAPGERHLDWDVSGPDGSFRMLPLGAQLFARTQDDSGRPIEAVFADGGVPPGNRGNNHQVVTRFPEPAAPGNVILQRPAFVRVVVRTPEGQPVPRARVLLRTAQAAPFGQPLARHQFTDGQGRTPALAVPPGSLVLEVIPDQIVSYPPGPVRDGHLKLALAPGERRDNVELIVPASPPASIP